MRALLAGAGFAVTDVEDRTDYGIAFFRERLSGGAPPPLGIHLLMGQAARTKLENMLHGLEHGAVAPVVVIARRGDLA
jgi:hypothetical protein